MLTLPRSKASTLQRLPRRHWSSSSTPATRRYGPSPSDLRPGPVLSPTRSLGNSPRKGRGWGWPESARSKLQQYFASLKERGELDQFGKWRRSPLAAEMIAAHSKKIRALENRDRLMQLLTRFQPRRLTVWTPSRDTPELKFRITVFGQIFWFSPPGEPFGPIRGDQDVQLSVFVSLSLSLDGPHPRAARRLVKRDGSRLDMIGIRVFGNHPRTEEPFDEWAQAGDSLLQRILDVADSVVDQAALREICITGLKHNLAGEQWKD